MPELPEIETIRAKLRQRIHGRVLKKITLRRHDLRYPMPVALINKLAKTAVVEVRRRSKYLIIDLANGSSLILHLGMSGRLFFTQANAVFSPHDHVLFDFQEGLHLRLRDPRRFGALDICDTAALSHHRFVKNLGLEPLETGFNGDSFYQMTCRSSSPIKIFLMNAKYVVGVGNIYASEALFLSQIKPQRKADSITRDQAQKLCAAVKKVLSDSIAMGGTTFRDYVDVDENPGLHQLALNVYDREHERCHLCGNSIKRVIMGQRSTFYCIKCQK